MITGVVISDKNSLCTFGVESVPCILIFQHSSFEQFLWHFVSLIDIKPMHLQTGLSLSCQEDFHRRWDDGSGNGWPDRLGGR